MGGDSIFCGVVVGRFEKLGVVGGMWTEALVFVVDGMWTEALVFMVGGMWTEALVFMVGGMWSEALVFALRVRVIVLKARRDKDFCVLCRSDRQVLSGEVVCAWRIQRLLCVV